VLAEVEDNAAARDAFNIALDLHPDYPDAHFHLAGVLERLGERQTAAVHWGRYLEFDQRGPWAEIARERLFGEPE
jgi:predicted TPR repeat methyltransferase